MYKYYLTIETNNSYIKKEKVGTSYEYNLDKELINEFLYHSLQSFYFEFNYKKFASGSAQPQLPIKDLENFMVPIPQMSEQLKIIKIANKISNKILLANVQLDKYQNLKKALMQDLLMGKSGIKF